MGMGGALLQDVLPDGASRAFACLGAALSALAVTCVMKSYTRQVAALRHALLQERERFFVLSERMDELERTEQAVVEVGVTPLAMRTARCVLAQPPRAPFLTAESVAYAASKFRAVCETFDSYELARSRARAELSRIAAACTRTPSPEDSCVVCMSADALARGGALWCQRGCTRTPMCLDCALCVPASTCPCCRRGNPARRWFERDPEADR